MPQFSYNAIDAKGQRVEGSLDAVSENELIVRLSSQGLRVQHLQKGQPAPLTGSIRTAPSQTPVPSVRRDLEVTSTPRVGTYSPRLSGPSVRTKRAKYATLHFLFAQLSTLLRAGINPASALQEVAQRQARPDLRQALLHMATLTTEGRSMSSAMEVYPDFFPPGAVGTVRAGEAGGYVWQALEALSEQNNQAHKMAWAARLFRWVSVLGLVAIPFTLVATKALDSSFEEVSGLPGYIQGVGRELTGPLGWIVGLIIVTYVVAAALMRKTEHRPLRHRLGTALPIFGRRAKIESLANFNWHLSKLSEAGIPPSTAWNLASSALPNEEFARRMEAVGQTVLDKNKLSELVRRSGMFPFEYVGLVETGEMAGHLPGALEQASRLAADDLKQADRVAKVSLYGAYLAMFAVIAVVCCATFYSGYFNSLYKHTVGETEAE